MKNNDNHIEVLHIFGIIISELLKSKKVSVNSINNELWFTDKKDGKTLKMRMLNKEVK